MIGSLKNQFGVLNSLSRGRFVKIDKLFKRLNNGVFSLFNIEGRLVIMPNGIIEIISILFFSFRSTRKEQKKKTRKRGAADFFEIQKRKRESDGGNQTGATED